MNYIDDSDLPLVTDEQLQESLKDSDYTVPILRAGPKFEVPGPDRASVVAERYSAALRHLRQFQQTRTETPAPSRIPGS